MFFPTWPTEGIIGVCLRWMRYQNKFRRFAIGRIICCRDSSTPLANLAKENQLTSKLHSSLRAIQRMESYKLHDAHCPQTLN